MTRPKCFPWLGLLLALNAAAGVRGDIGDQFFLKTEGSAEWIEMSGDWIQSVRAPLAAGWKF